MNQEDIERRLQELFGAGAGKTTHGQSQKEIDNPAFVPPGTPGFNPNIPPKITVTEETWKDASGNALTIQRWPDGSIKETGATTAPTKSSASSDESVSAPPNQQQIASRQPDDTIKWVPNPNYQPPGANRTPEQQATDAANARSVQEENRERQWNSDHGYGWVTHAQREQAIRQQQADARAQNSADRAAAAQEAANQLSRDRLQFDKDKANLPTVKVEDVNVNGTRFTRVTSVTPDGKTVGIRSFGPDGKPIERIPSEGEASKGGPPIPTIMRDTSAQALTNYHTALWNDPSLTPEQREKRFQEAVQVANVVNQQWTADEQRRATEQRERESVRNAEYNTAVSRLTFQQNGLSNALDFVSKINGSLPEGSDLGGRAFAALLGLNMLQMQRSGINNLPSLNAPRAPLPTITAADLSKPEALATHNQAIAAATAEAAAPPPAPTPTQQNVGAGTGEPPARSALPAQPAAPRVGPPATQPGSPPPPVTAEQAQDYYQQGVNPATGDAIYDPSRESGVGAPIPTAIPPNEIGQPGDPGYQDQAQVFSPVQGNIQQVAGAQPSLMKPAEPVQPDYGQPGMRVLPQPPTGMDVPPDERVNYGDGQDMPKIAGEWPILGKYMQPPSQGQVRPQPPMEQPPEEAPAALRRAQIRSTPPWRLSPDDLAWAQANGMEDDYWSTPGRVA